MFSTYYLKFKIKLLLLLLNIPDEITDDHADEEAFLVCLQILLDVGTEVVQESKNI